MSKSHTLHQIRVLSQFKLVRRRRKIPRQIQPDAIRLGYASAILGVLGRAHALASRFVFPRLPGLLEAARRARGDSARGDGPGQDVNSLIDSASKEFFDALRPGELDAMARQFAERTSDFQKAQLKAQVVAGLGIDPIVSETNLTPLIEAFTAENVALIKSVPNQYFDEMEKEITSAVRSGQRFEDLADDLQDRYAVGESRARLIARDQIGKFYGELNQTRQTEIGVESYIWQTMNDNRVRDEHSDRQGQKFQWDNPPEDGHPGEAIQCRCYAEPDFSAILGDD